MGMPRRAGGPVFTLCAFNLCVMSRAFVSFPLPPRRAVGHACVAVRSIRIPTATAGKGAALVDGGAYNLTEARIAGIQRRRRTDNITGQHYRCARARMPPPARPPARPSANTHARTHARAPRTHAHIRWHRVHLMLLTCLVGQQRRCGR